MNEIVHVQPHAVEQRSAPFTAYIHPILVLLCQGLSVVSLTGALSVLSSNLSLTIPYAIFIAFSISTFLSFIFSRSAMQVRALEIVLRSPGGVVLSAFAVVLALFLIMIEPVLLRNGYTPTTAITVTLLAQVPLGTVNYLSRRTLNRIFAEAWYDRALACLMREVHIKRNMQFLNLIRSSLVDVKDMAKGTPIEAQLTAILAETELNIDNVTGLIRLVCEKGPTYQDPVYHVLYVAISKHLEEILAPKPVMISAKSGDRTSEYDDLLEILRRGDLK